MNQLLMKYCDKPQKIIIEYNNNKYLEPAYYNCIITF